MTTGDARPRHQVQRRQDQARGPRPRRRRRRRRRLTPQKRHPPACHPERSEGPPTRSRVPHPVFALFTWGVLRFAQDDNGRCATAPPSSTPTRSSKRTSPAPAASPTKTADPAEASSPPLVILSEAKDPPHDLESPPPCSP